MKFSLESDYAVRIVLQLYISPNKREKSSQVLEECRIPPKLGQRTITKLVKAEVLRSIRGNAGGVEVIKRPEDLSLYEVISAVEDLTIKKCIDNPENCRWKCVDCSLYKNVVRIKKRFLQDLKDVKFKDLIEQM